MRDVYGLEPLDLVLTQRERLGRQCVLDVLDPPKSVFADR
jgi:hypothetical protein